MGAGEMQDTGILRAKGSRLLPWAVVAAWTRGPGLDLEGALPHSPEGRAKGKAKGKTGQ